MILHLSAPGMSDISVKEPPADTPSEQVRYCMDIMPSHDSSMAGNPMYTHNNSVLLEHNDVSKFVLYYYCNNALTLSHTHTHAHSVPSHDSSIAGNPMYTHNNSVLLEHNDACPNLFCTTTAMKSTKVLNPWRCIMRVHEKYTCSIDTHAVQIRMLYRYTATSFSETVNTRATYVGR